MKFSPRASAESACVTLERVDIEASAISGPARQQELIAPYLGKCIDAQLTRRILSEISNHFIDKGYVTTRPYLLEQDVGDGQIEIRILVGSVEAVVDAETGAGNGKIATAFLFNGEILNLRELETSLEIIERVSSVDASFEIRPGTQPGASVVAIRTTVSDPFRLELGANTQTGLDNQLSLQAILDNPLGINDILQIRVNHGDVLKSYQSNSGEELSYSFPLGAYLLAISRSDISFEQRIQGINESLLSEGDTVTERLRVSRVVARNQSNRLTAAVSLELKDTENFFEDELIEVSSYRTSQLRLELQHDWMQPWGQLVTRYTYHQGLESFGARDDDFFTGADGSDSDARLQFEMFSLDSQMLYYLRNPDWQLGLNLHLQYSDDVLFDSDKLSLGSPYTVRGYSAALSGSNAGYLRSDITRQFHSLANPLSGNTLTKSVGLSFGLDYGEVKCEIDNRDTCGEIYAAALGVVVWDANFSGRMQWGHPLKEIGDDVGDEDRFLLDLRWAL